MSNTIPQKYFLNYFLEQLNLFFVEGTRKNSPGFLEPKIVRNLHQRRINKHRERQ